MNKLVQRLLIFFIGIPVVLGFVCLDVFSHLPFNALLIVISAIAASELCTIFSSGGETLPKPLLISLCAAIPACTYISLLFPCWFFAFNLCDGALIAAVFIIFAFEIFSARTFEKSNARIARSVCTIFYAGFLPSYITKISFTPFSTDYLVTFLVMVFISDSAAWLFGMLFGKNNRGKVAASPNKSIAGFVGAYLGCILVAFLASYLVFPSAFSVSNRALRVLVLGIVVCTASIVGDLAESVFKRSANVKDSGKIILGRGGILDCVDSVFMAAPFYYYLLIQLFYFHFPSV
ncbi:MAG: phosphatidate cytidylyltransferase [Treponemataceae bacterium]|nr:phosphatidate cytidylyltransferase [Treponemataceae bacterium]